MSPKSCVFLPRRSNAHLHSGIDKCVQNALNRRAVLRDGFGLEFCCVQSVGIVRALEALEVV